MTPEGQTKRAKSKMAQEPTPDPAKPRKPPGLSGVAGRKWDQLAPQLHTSGVLTKVDGDTLEQYCRVWAFYREEMRAVETEGRVITTKTGYPMINPHWTAANQAITQCRKLAAELGLSPSTRTRLQVDKPQRPDSPLTKMLKQRSG